MMVGAVRRFAVPVHPHARESEPRLGQQPLRRRVQQRDGQVVHAIVVVRAEAREILRSETGLVAQAVAAEQRRAVAPRAIEAEVVAVVLEIVRARVEVVVGRIVAVRLHDVLRQDVARDGIDPVGGDLVARKLIADELRVGRADRQRGIERRVGPIRQRVVDRRVAREVA